MRLRALVQFRTSDDERKAYERDAEKRGLVLSTWIRLACSMLISNTHDQEKKSK